MYLIYLAVLSSVILLLGISMYLLFVSFRLVSKQRKQADDFQNNQLEIINKQNETIELLRKQFNKINNHLNVENKSLSVTENNNTSDIISTHFGMSGVVNLKPNIYTSKNLQNIMN